MNSHCPHVTTGVGRLSHQDLNQLLSSPACDVCRRTGNTTNLWLCLFPDCYSMGCSESSNDHSTQHNQKNVNHCLQLNVANKRVWCYKCGVEVLLSRNQPKVPGALGVNRAKVPCVLGTEKVNRGETEDDEDCYPPPALVGLSNLGNTCYMNSALQCLSNTPSLTKFFINCSEMIPRSEKPLLGQAYLKLVAEMWRGGGDRFVAPAEVLQAIKQTYPMFRGFQQHDAHEFLRCFMDQLHKELEQPSQHEEEDENEGKNDFLLGGRSSPEAGDCDGYETAESGEEDELGTPEVHQEDAKEGGVGYQEDVKEAGVLDQEESLGGRKRKFSEQSEAKDSGLGSVSSFQVSDKQLDESSTPRRTRPDSDSQTCESSSVLSRSVNSSFPAKHLSPPNKKARVIQYRSVISDIFNGKLVSSVQCLSCDRVSTTTETFQDLSLTIPSQEALQVIRKEAGDCGQDEGEEGWLSWAWSWIWGWPWYYSVDVNLFDCLAYFFSADELKGDNMYSCEKCKKLRNGIKHLKVTELPDTLCIQLKRFRHDFELSSKISTRVTFPLSDLDMSPWLHADCTSKQSLYDLTGVICHHGVAGDGHYTSYCFNDTDNSWYEFNDKSVQRVEAATVAQAEAYVLFYRKKSGGMEAIRGKVKDLQQKDSHSLVKFYISNEWLNKFYSMAEPGPIDNSSVICRHGGVLPQRLDTANKLCTAVNPKVWRFLYEKFGGCVAVNRLKKCEVCYAEVEEEERKKRFELEEFKALIEKQAEEEGGADSYCVASGWFRGWEGWVLGRARERPGPVDNNCLVVIRGGAAGLRPNSDYIKFSEDIWSMFHSVYGGGPQVVITGGGGVRVSNPTQGTTLSKLTETK